MQLHHVLTNLCGGNIQSAAGRQIGRMGIHLRKYLFLPPADILPYVFHFLKTGQGGAVSLLVGFTEEPVSLCQPDLCFYCDSLKLC